MTNSVFRLSCTCSTPKPIPEQIVNGSPVANFIDTYFKDSLIHTVYCCPDFRKKMSKLSPVMHEVVDSQRHTC